MSNSVGAAPIEALGANVLNTRFEHLDKALVESTKDRIIDIFGCAIGGANAPANAGMINLIKQWGGKKESTIWVHGGKAPAHNVAMVNAVINRSYDFEELGGSHQSGTTIPAAFAMGEAVGTSGKELLTALIAGNDVGYRVSRGFDFDFFQGFDGIGTIQVFPVTATSGRLLGLNQFQMRNAFGIVLTQTSGTIQDIWDGAATFKLPQGIAGRNGIFAAELAKAGWTGVKDALQSRFGYYNLYTHGCTHPELITQDLGKVYYGFLGYKRYPSGGPNHIGLEGAMKMLAKYNLKADDIAEITLRVNKHSLANYYAKPWEIRDFPQGDAIFSYRYTMAAAMVRGHFKLEDLTENAIRDPIVNELIKKINVAEIPEDIAKSHKGAVEISMKTKDGREFRDIIEGGSSGPGSKPLSRQEVITKFWDQVEFSKTVTRKNAARLLSLVEKLEDVDKVSKVVELLVA